MSIRRKLLFLLLAVGASAALLGLGGASVVARREVRRQAVGRFAAIAGAWRAALEPPLRQLEDDVHVLAADTRYSACMSLASANPTDFAATPGDVRSANLCLTQQALHTRWGSTFVLLSDAGLQIIREEDEQRDIGKSFADRPAVKRALAGATAFEADLAAGELRVAVPVTSPEGRRLGAAVAGLDLGDLLASAGRALGVEIAPAPGATPGPAAESTAGGRDLIAQIVVLSAPDGTPLLPVRLQEDLGRALAPFERTLREGALAGGAGALLLALVLALVVAGGATRPLREMSEAAAAIAHGAYETRVTVRSRDEIGGLARSFNAMAEGLGQRVFFESALRRYLAPSAVDALVQDPTRMRLGGERRELTVLFFDVAGFTTLSETLGPDALVSLCNGYLEQVVAAVFSAGGTLDKFIGDAVMALFGAPLDQPDHAARGCRAALAMQRAFEAHVAAADSPSVRGLHARIGLHSGIAAFGNLGTKSIMSLTAMGDAVNLASRLEGVNKLFGTRVLASEATAKAAGPDVAARELDCVRVVGRREPVRIFELHAPGAIAADVGRAYAAGLAAYRARRFDEAAREFDAAAAKGDSPASVMAKRCREYAAAPPPPAWDGALGLDHK